MTAVVNFSIGRVSLFNLLIDGLIWPLVPQLVALFSLEKNYSIIWLFFEKKKKKNSEVTFSTYE